MAFDPAQYTTTTRRQRQEYAPGWNAWASLLETGLAVATDRMLDLAEVTARSSVIDAPVQLPSAAECPRFRRESFDALHQALASLSPEEQRSVWAEIEDALGQFETDPGFVGPCELLIAGAT